MKNLVLTVILSLFVCLLFTKTCEAQTQNLPIKIEETQRGNGEWDKVSVLLPNESYKIYKMSYEDKKLFVVFSYTREEEQKSQPITFLLSDYDIDYKRMSADDEIFVIGKDSDYLKASKCPPNCPPPGSLQGSRLADSMCPAICPF